MTNPARHRARCCCSWVVALLAGCAGVVEGERAGPPFAEAFPDPAILVTTSQPERVRALLATVQLPPTVAHHDTLLRLLRGCGEISGQHLLLLVEAVAVPSDRVAVLGDRSRVWVRGARGSGPFVHVTEQLYSEALDRLVDVDRRTFGALVGHTESNATMFALADRFLPELDDGSADALGQMLAAMPGSLARGPFLIDYLAPRGRLDGERGWQLLGELAFDSERVALLEALVARADRLDGARVAAAVDTMHFDAGRRQALALLVRKARPVSAAAAEATVAGFSFDSERLAAVATLATAGALEVDEQQLVAMVRRCSFDEGRRRCVEILAPSLAGRPRPASAQALLALFSFDVERLAVVGIMAARWRAFDAAECERLLATFSFSSNRAAARRLLAAAPASEPR